MGGGAREGCRGVVTRGQRETKENPHLHNSKPYTDLDSEKRKDRERQSRDKEKGL